MEHSMSEVMSSVNPCGNAYVIDLFLFRGNFIVIVCTKLRRRPL